MTNFMYQFARQRFGELAISPMEITGREFGVPLMQPLGGKILRERVGKPHCCDTPGYTQTAAHGLQPGTVWRCECGKRWTLRETSTPHWLRRYWPWPR